MTDVAEAQREITFLRAIEQVKVMTAAADEIERLKASNAELVVALEAAAAALDGTADYVRVFTSHKATAVGICYDAKAARAAIEKAATP